MKIKNKNVEIREKLNNFLRKNFYNIEKILNLNEYKPNNYIQYKIIHKTLYILLYTLFISIFNY